MANCSINRVTIVPDPDISGPGVLLSFLITAVVTFVVSMLGHVLPLLPESNITERPSTSPNPLRMAAEAKDFWLALIECFLRGLSDQQLVTGLIILVVGFSKWDITVYHFTIVCDLSWISSSTHFCTIDTLRDNSRAYSTVTSWRIAFMILLYLGLAISLILMAHDHWNNSLAAPAYCLFQTTAGNITKPKTILILLLSAGQTTLGYFLAIRRLLMQDIQYSQAKATKASSKLTQRTARNHLQQLPASYQMTSMPSSYLETTPRSTLANHAHYRPRAASLTRRHPLRTSLTIIFKTTFFTLGLLSLNTDLRRGCPLINAQDNPQLTAWSFGQLVAPPPDPPAPTYWLGDIFR